MLVLVVADGEEVEEITDVDIVGEAEKKNVKMLVKKKPKCSPAKIAGELGVEVHHVLEVGRGVVGAGLLDGGVEPVDLLGEDLDLALDPDEKPVPPDPDLLRMGVGMRVHHAALLAEIDWDTCVLSPDTGKVETGVGKFHILAEIA